MMANPNRAGIAWGDARGGESGPRHLLPDSKWLVLHVVLGSFRLPSSLPRSSLPPREHPCRFVANPSPSRVPDSLVKLCLLLLPRPPPGPATPSTVHPLPRHDTAFPIHLDYAPAADHDHDHGHGHDHDHACDPTTLLACSRPDTTANKVADIYFCLSFSSLRLFDLFFVRRTASQHLWSPVFLCGCRRPINTDSQRLDEAQLRVETTPQVEQNKQAQKSGGPSTHSLHRNSD